MIQEEVLKSLTHVNWDFTDSKTNGTMHGIHPYPAKFIPQIPHMFIENLSQIGETIYDPFVGSGTTCLEANLLGRNAIGNDVNELATLITKVKTTPIPPEQLIELDSLIEKICVMLSQKVLAVTIPNIVNIESWFKDFVWRELVVIKTEIEQLNDEILYDFCRIALAAIIVNVSNQDSDTRYVRVEKKLKEGDVVVRFVRQLNKMRQLMEHCYNQVSLGQTEVKCADSRQPDIFSKDRADLAITSPPYPNAYDYHLYHKYRLLWLDMNPIALKAQEIGAHAHYSKKNALNEFDFQKDMKQCFLNVSQILKYGKIFIIVIGDSILQGRNIKNNVLLSEVAQETPFHFITEFSRKIDERKKHFNPKIGNIKTEQVMLFENLK